jgi:hypothetical protein
MQLPKSNPIVPNAMTNALRIRTSRLGCVGRRPGQALLPAVRRMVDTHDQPGASSGV